MAEVIDISHNKNFQRKNSQPYKIQKVDRIRVNKFQKILQDLLTGSSKVNEFIVKRKDYFQIVITSNDDTTESCRHHHIRINCQGQELSTKVYFLKNNIFSSAFTKQKRINLFRTLLKLKKYSIIKMAIDPSNGLIFGCITVKLRKIFDFKFIVRQLVRCQYSMCNIMTLLLNNINGIPMKVLDVSSEKKRQNFAKFLQNQTKIHKKINRFLNFSEDQIKINQSNGLTQGSDLNQIIQEVRQDICDVQIFKQSLQLFEHDEDQLNRQYKQKYISICNDDQESLLMNLKTNSSSNNRNVYNECEIQNSQVVQVGDSYLRGGGHKILVAKLHIRNIKFQNKLSNDLLKFLQKQTRSKAKFEFKIVAIKEPLELTQRTLKKAMNEVKILQKLSQGECPYFLRYYSSSQQNFCFKNRVMMDFLFESQSLTKYLSSNNETLSFPMKFFVLTKVIQGLYFLHENQVVHMDMSFGNILITKSSTKIIDFGQSYHKSVYPDKKYDPGFTLPFTPPQRFTNNNYSIKYDIYSFAIIMYKTFFSTFPYNKNSKLIEDLKTGNYRKKMFIVPQGCSDECYEKIMDIILFIINKGMKANIEKRHHSSSLVLIMKQIFYWFAEYADLPYNS